MRSSRMIGILLSCMLLCNLFFPVSAEQAEEALMQEEHFAGMEQFEESIVSEVEAPVVYSADTLPPQASEYLYQDDFSVDGQLAPNLVKTGSTSGTLTVANGALELTRTASSISGVNASDAVQFWTSQDHLGTTQPLVGIEFYLKKSAEKQFAINFCDSNGTEFIRLTFLSNGSVSAQYRDEPDGININAVIAEQAELDTYGKWNFLLNNQTKLFSVWKDDRLVLENRYFTAQQSDFGYVEAVMERRNTQTLAFDSFSAYTVMPDDETAVNTALADLVFEKFTNEPISAVTHNLTLPTEGLLDTTITWNSTDPATISPDGTVTRPAGEDAQVTLSAQVSKGSVTKEKQFTITVMHYTVTQKPSPMDGYLIDDALQAEEFDSRIETEGEVKATTAGAELSAGGRLKYTFEQNGDGLRTPFAVEFQLSGEGDTIVSLSDASNGDIPFLKVEEGNLWMWNREQEGDGAAWKQVKQGLEAESRFLLVHNPYMQGMSLWYGEDKLAELTLADSGGRCIEAVVFEQSSQRALLANLKVYQANLPDIEKVYYDAIYTEFDKLTYQKESYVTDNLTLPTVGKYGSSISWQSDSEDVVEKDGTVHVPSSGTVPVTLQARFYSGGEERERTYNFTVAACQKDEMPRVKKMLLEENFDDDALHANWEFIPNGGAITVENEKLKITRTQTAASETIANMYFSQDQSRLFGIYGVEFTLDKLPSASFWIRLRGNVDFFACNWIGNNLSCWNGINGTVTATVSSQEAYKVTLLLNANTSKYTLWINDKLIVRDVNGRGTDTGVSYLYLYLTNQETNPVELDNFKFYETYPLSDEAMEDDLAWLTRERIAAGSVLEDMPDVLTGDLNLVTMTPLGTEITWSSSNEAVLSTDGTYHPENITPDVESVTVTAELKAADLIRTKEFVFKIKQDLTSEEERFRADCELLDYEYLSLHENGAQEIKRSLNFPGTLAYGTQVIWSSDQEKYITKSGRVTRPRAGEEDVTVTVSANLQLGQYRETKTFTFTVLADEPFVDPQYMTDEEFFGVYSDGSWITEGKLNYDYDGLEGIEEAVMAGDYKLAKERLLYYFQNRKSNTVIGSGLQNTSWVDMLMDDFYHMQGAEFYQGQLWPANEWQETYADVKTDYVSAGSTVCYSVRAWYNESSQAEIAGVANANPSLRPKLILTINGVSQTIEAVDSVMIRAGSYMDTSLGEREILQVQNFGDFLGDGTKQAIIKFNLPNIPSDAVISSARLVLYARALPAQSGAKRLIVLREPTNTWTSQTATWNTFPGYVYSYNGLPEKNNWAVRPEGADSEYLYQMARFSAWGAVDTEYWLTQDDTYAYKAQRIVEDYITDVGNWKSTSLYFTYDENGIRGGFPRSLDVAFKNNAFCQFALDELLKSPYATADYCTALLKNIWDTAHYQTVYHTTDATNWRQYEFESLLYASVCVPEFKDALEGDNWRAMASEVLESALFTNVMSDGSYIEGTGQYSVTSFANFKEYKEFMYKNDASVTEAYDRLLLLNAYYNVLMYHADGTSLQYGDEALSTRSASLFTDLAEWYNDTELEYIATFGKSGTEPDWTSRHFPDSAVTTMRTDWSADSPYLFTNVRGGGGHSHSDDNAVVVSAYGRVLLNDAGIFTYSASDPYRQWGVTSRAHNTVVINDKDQVRSGNGPRTTGKVYDWSTNSEFDFLSQSTPQNTGFEHRRTIAYLKPDIWIVSDLMTPDSSNRNQANNYKQIWHMLPDAGLTTEEGKIYSTYPSGANVIVASADKDAEIKEEMGWYDWSSQQVEEAKFAFMEKDAVTGQATFDSVIMAYDGTQADVSVEKLAESTEYTALKLNILRNGVRSTGYYLMTYEGGEHTFGKYKTDAQMVFIEENADGTVETIQMKDGSYVTNTESGVNLIENEEKISEITVRLSQTSIYINANEEMSFQGVRLYADSEAISKVYVNGQKVGFHKEGHSITGIGEGTAPQEPQTGGSGGIIGGSGGGSGSGGTGGSGSISPGDITPPEKDSAALSFDDMQGHWAAEYVKDLVEKGIAKGKTQTQFAPDDVITRAEFIALVIRAVDQEADYYEGQFEDVNAGDWYAGAIQRALERGLISADAYFRPNDNITRQEISKIITNAYLLRGGTAASDYEFTYEDQKQISQWAAGFVKFVSAAGLMNGDSDGNFRPLDHATRAESAAVISRMLEKK